MQLDQLLATYKEAGFDKVKVGGFDIDGVLRGKYISLDKFVSAATSGFGFCDVIFGWDSADELYEGVPIEVTGWHTGYPDCHCELDVSTARRIPWEAGQPFFLIDFHTSDRAPHPASPRQLLQKIDARAKEMGYTAKFSAEFEYWLFRETPHSVREKGYRQMTPLTPGMFGYSCARATENSELFSRIFTDMKAFDVDLEGLHTETGPGVLEAAITYDDVVRAADKACLFKTGMKELAIRHDCIATFMAKWTKKLPGSSGHSHQSLWRGDTNAFYDADDALGMSDIFKHYVAGVLETMGDFAALYAPTINSYRRLVPGMWAPTRACWAPDNRTGSARTIHGPKPSSSRLEFRVPGADMNAYIAFAGMLAAGLWGIENKVPLRPAVTGNAYALPESEAPSLPATLADASARLRKSKIARELLGDVFVDHYCSTRDWEVQQAASVVTDWELRRYFEVI